MLLLLYKKLCVELIVNEYFDDLCRFYAFNNGISIVFISIILLYWLNIFFSYNMFVMTAGWISISPH